MKKEIELEKILEHINQNTHSILEKLDVESIVVYEFLQKEFSKKDVSKDCIFQFMFRSYYRLDNAGLTTEWKQKYFEAIEKNKNNLFDIKKFLLDFSNIKTLRKYNSVQFSFATKAWNILDENKPIYDSFVAKVFNFSPTYSKDINKKIDNYTDFYKKLEEIYQKILKEDLLKEVLKKFDNKFKNNTLSQIKKIDFIFWAAGKIK